MHTVNLNERVEAAELAKQTVLEVWTRIDGNKVQVFYVFSNEMIGMYLFKSYQQLQNFLNGDFHEKYELSEEEYVLLEEFDFNRRTDINQLKTEVYES